MRDIFPRSRSLWANRGSNLVSSSLACFCSSSGQLSRPWRFNSSRIKYFEGSPADPPGVHVGRVTGGTQLAGVTFLMMTMAGTTMGQAPRFLRHIGTWEGPRCNSPYVVAGTREVGSWGPMLPLQVHGPACSALRHLSGHGIFMVPNRGMVNLCVVQTCPWMSSRQNSLDAVGLGHHSPCTFEGQLE